MIAIDAMTIIFAIIYHEISVGAAEQDILLVKTVWTDLTISSIGTQYTTELHSVYRMNPSPFVWRSASADVLLAWFVQNHAMLTLAWPSEFLYTRAHNSCVYIACNFHKKCYTLWVGIHLEWPHIPVHGPLSISPWADALFWSVMNSVTRHCAAFTICRLPWPSITHILAA